MANNYGIPFNADRDRWKNELAERQQLKRDDFNSLLDFVRNNPNAAEKALYPNRFKVSVPFDSGLQNGDEDTLVPAVMPLKNLFGIEQAPPPPAWNTMKANQKDLAHFENAQRQERQQAHTHPTKGKWLQSTTDWINKNAGINITTEDRVSFGKQLFGDKYTGTKAQNIAIVHSIWKNEDRIKTPDELKTREYPEQQLFNNLFGK